MKKTLFLLLIFIIHFFILINFVFSITPLIADFDGDSRDDIALFDPPKSMWTITYSSNLKNTVYYGGLSDIAVPAKYMGNKNSEIAVYRPSEGKWYIHGHQQCETGCTWGWNSNSLIPIPADYDGDGKANLAVYNTTDGKWYIHSYNNEVPIEFKETSGIPLVADFRGNGKKSLVVYKNNKWYNYEKDFKETFLAMDYYLDYTPAKFESGLITINGNNFFLNGKKWYPYGVNYFPEFIRSGGSSANWWHWNEFKEEVENDFRIISSAGFNTIKIQFFDASMRIDTSNYNCSNLKKFFELAKKYNLRILLAVVGNSWHANPNIFQMANNYSLIRNQHFNELFNFLETCNLSNEENVYAISFDWEAATLPYQYTTPEALELWSQWIITNYGTYENAKIKFGNHSWIQTNCGTNHNLFCPPQSRDPYHFYDTQDRQAMLIAYKRFINDVLNKRYELFTNLFRKSFPNTLFSAESNYEWDGSSIEFSNRDTQTYLDFSTPHLYLGPHQYDLPLLENNSTNFFNSITIKSLGLYPEKKPVIYGEYGSNTYYPNNICLDGKCTLDSPCPGGYCDELRLQKIQTIFLEQALKTATNDGIKGGYFWWFVGRRPGGNERGTTIDFVPSGECRDGIDNDNDGTIDREGIDTDGDGLINIQKDIGCVDGEISDYGIIEENYLLGPKPVYFKVKEMQNYLTTTTNYNPTNFFNIDLTKNYCITTLITQAYTAGKISNSASNKAITQCSNNNSITAPLLCVDGTLATCNNEICCPLLCLNSMFKSIEIIDASGNTIDLTKQNEKNIQVIKGNPIFAKINITNIGESSFAINDIVLSIKLNDSFYRDIPLDKEIKGMESIIFENFEIGNGVEGKIELRLKKKRNSTTGLLFGEKIILSIIPVNKPSICSQFTERYNSNQFNTQLSNWKNGTLSLLEIIKRAKLNKYCN
jgi:hypothetical protein